MSEPITLRGVCGKIIKGKLWKQGGSMKCPTHWSFITYPKPERIDLWRDINSLCRGCESIDSDSVRTCPKCSGSGRVEDVCNHLEFTKECELCDGVGKVPAESDTKRMVKP